MIRKIIIDSWLLILLVLSAQLPAQKVVNLQEAYRTGLENSLSLKQQQISVDQADLDRLIHRSDYLPAVEFSAGYNHVSELAQLELPPPLSTSIGSIQAGAKNQYDLSLQLSQTIFSGFRTRNLIKASESRTEAEQINESAIRNDLLLNIGMIYYRIQANLLNQEVLTAAIDRIDRRLQQAKNFYNAGQAAPFDTLESANAKLQQQTQLQSLRYAEQILLKQFANLLNTRDKLLVLREDIESTMTGNQAMAGETAADSRAEIRQLTHLASAQRYAARAQRSALFPQVYAAATYHYARPGVNFFRDEWMDYYTVGVNLRWTLWNWRKDRHKVDQADLAARQIELRQQQLRQAIDAEITTAYQSRQSAESLVKTQRLLVERETERYRISEEKFRQNQIGAIDLSDAESDLTTATLLLQQYMIQVREWQLQLDHATGELGEMFKSK